MKKILITIGIIIVMIAISYGVCVLFTALGLWALVKLGELTFWTWKQAALIAIIMMIGLTLINSTAKRK